MKDPQPIWSRTAKDVSAEVVQFPGGEFVLYVWDLRDKQAKAMKRTFSTREDAVIAGVNATKEQA